MVCVGVCVCVCVCELAYVRGYVCVSGQEFGGWLSVKRPDRHAVRLDQSARHGLSCVRHKYCNITMWQINLERLPARDVVMR